MPTIEENDWVRDGDTTVFRKSIPLYSYLGQCILSDLAIRYPQFKPKYINQIREHEDASFDMVVADVVGPDGLVVDTLDDNGMPKPQEYHHDVASVTYILAGEKLDFGQMYTFYDIALMNMPTLPPELRKFYELYKEFKQHFPDMFSLIEHLASIYEKRIDAYNGAYQSLAIRELLWTFTNIMIKADLGQNIELHNHA